MKCSYDRGLYEIENIVGATATFFEDHDIDSGIRFVVDLVIEELFVNMVKYNTGTEAQIEIEMTPWPQGIRVSLTDFDVERFDPTDYQTVDINAAADDRTPGGLGIFLVLKMIDSISYDYHNRVSKITFIKTTESLRNV